MERAEKVEFLEKLTDRFGRAPIAVLTDYRGLNVAQITALRRKVREADGEYLVAKNTLTRLAVSETTAAALTEMDASPRVRAIVVIHRLLSADKAKHLKLSGAIPPIREMLGIAGITQFIEMYDTVDEAVASF